MTTDGTALAQTLQDFPGNCTRVRLAQVCVMAGEQVVAVWLEARLPPGDRQMAGTQAGREMLQEPGERVLDQARLLLQQLAETHEGKRHLGQSPFGSSRRQ